MKEDKAKRGHGTSGLSSMSMANIRGDPFVLATISFSILAWLVAFVGSTISTTRDVANPYPNYCWFSVAFMFCLIVGIFVVIASDTAQIYQVAIIGFLGPGLVLTSSSVNSLILTSNIARDAAACGFILLSIISIVWIFYFADKTAINSSFLTLQSKPDTPLLARAASALASAPSQAPPPSRAYTITAKGYKR